MRALNKVLVVDDDAVVGQSFNRVLSHKGYVVVTAQNAHEALKKMREDEFDLVYTDIKMPGMDGLELAQQLKARRPWVPVVIVTGYGSGVSEERARAAGVSAFLHKPLSPEMIEDSATDALRAPRAAPAATEPEVAGHDMAPAASAAPESNLKNVALFLAAPFIGLVYALFLPVVGMAMLAWMGGQALMKMPRAARVLRALKNVGLVIAAPFVGLVYALLLPVVGTAMLAWIGLRSLLVKPTVE